MSRKRNWLWALFLATQDKKDRKEALELFGAYKTVSGLFGSKRSPEKENSDDSNGCAGCGCLTLFLFVGFLMFINGDFSCLSPSTQTTKQVVKTSSTSSSGKRVARKIVKSVATPLAKKVVTPPAKNGEPASSGTIGYKPSVTARPHDSNSELNQVFLKAVLEGNLMYTKILLSDGAWVNSRDRNRKTALMLATFKGHKEIVTLLLDSGADLNARSKNGQTAIIKAILGNHNDLVGLLIKHKADVNVRDEFRNSPILYAVMRENVEATRLLIDGGAYLAVRDINGRTPLKIARDSKNLKLIKLLEAKMTKPSHR